MFISSIWMYEQFCSHSSKNFFARSTCKGSSASQPPKAEFMAAHTCNMQSSSRNRSSCNHGTRDVALEMFFLALFCTVFWTKSSNHKQGAGGLKLLTQLLLPSHKPGEGDMFSSETPKGSLFVCVSIYRLQLFYLCPLEPENANKKGFKLYLVWAWM